MSARFLTATLAALASGLVLAQGTVGELLDAGGRQLTKEDVLATLVGANVSGANAGGAFMELTYKGDGTVAGSILSAHALGRGGPVWGTWTVDENGKVCRDVKITILDSRQVQNCAFFFRLSHDYYATRHGSSDRTEQVLKRTIKR